MAVERQFIVKLLADPSGLIDDFKTIRGETEKTFGVANEKLLRLMPTFKVLTTAAAGVFGGLVAGAGLASNIDSVKSSSPPAKPRPNKSTL